MSESAMSWYYSVTLVNVKAILHSAAIVKIIFHLHRSNNSARYTLYFVPPSTERHMHFADRYLSHVPPPQVRLPELCSTALNGYRTSSVIRTLYWSCSQAPGKTFQFARYKRSEPITCSLGGSRNDRNKPKFHLARHVSTRHDTTRSTCRAHEFWLCRACRTAQLDTLDTTSATLNLVCCVICIKLWYVNYSLIYWSIHLFYLFHLTE